MGAGMRATIDGSTKDASRVEVEDPLGTKVRDSSVGRHNDLRSDGVDDPAREVHLGSCCKDEDR
jgi:hypothetical protein